MLKKDLFGEVWLVANGDTRAILRDAGASPIWTLPIARWLLQREARVLAALDGIEGIPQLISCDRNQLMRSYLDGLPLYVGGTRDAEFFRQALRLLRKLHRSGVTHNDLAKEPNILVLQSGEPGFIDYQLASFSLRRGWFWRVAAREDLRHLLKHKRTYAAHALSVRQRRILATPSGVSRIWMRTAKPVYNFVTRRILGWADREGAADRGRRD